MASTMMKSTMTYKGVLLKHEPMSRHTSWRTGGLADTFYRPESIEDLQTFLSMQDRSEPVTWIGLGSNLLVPDEGVRGIVICTSGVLNGIQLLDDNRIYVETGIPSPKLARFSAKNSLKGAEFLCGIPGTIGGALKMNAGAVGGEMWNIVESVTTIDRAGRLYEHPAADFDIGYRYTNLKESNDNEWFVSVIVKLEPGNSSESLQKIKDHLNRRSTTQPTQQPNAGSVFRNPENDYAARLIESCGLKGFCIGGACVSEKHANFIINTGTATSGDIEILINKVHEVVLEKTGINLVREVKIIGGDK